MSRAQHQVRSCRRMLSERATRAVLGAIVALSVAVPSVTSCTVPLDGADPHASAIGSPSPDPATLPRHARPLRLVYPTPEGVNDPAQNFGDLYLPSARGTGVPLVVLYHGGSWRSSAGDLRGLAPMARALADRGVAVFNAEYRRVGSGGGWPTTLTDAQAAADFAAGLSRRFHTLSDEVTVLAGHSAGGQLALWAAKHMRTQPQAVVSIAGPSDLSYAASHGDRNVRMFLGGLPHQVPERYSSADPSANPSAPTSTLLLHGTHDRVVPIDVARHYLEDVQIAPHPTLIEIPGATHTSLVTPGRRGYAEVLAEVEKLIRQLTTTASSRHTAHVAQRILSTRNLGSTA